MAKTFTKCTKDVERFNTHLSNSARTFSGTLIGAEGFAVSSSSFEHWWSLCNKASVSVFNKFSRLAEAVSTWTSILDCRSLIYSIIGISKAEVRYSNKSLLSLVEMIICIQSLGLSVKSFWDNENPSPRFRTIITHLPSMVNSELATSLESWKKDNHRKFIEILVV